jgi:hypothetical protein
MIRLTLTLALACAGLFVVYVAGASADATQVPVAGLTIDLGSAPPPGTPGVKVKGNCPGFLFTDDIALQFISGNGHVYGPGPHPSTNGANAEGDAVLLDNGVATTYVGHLHTWFGQNVNPAGNQQFYFGNTLSFHATSSTGQSIQLNASGGGGSSASGNPTGWGQNDLSCS